MSPTSYQTAPPRVARKELTTSSEGANHPPASTQPDLDLDGEVVVVVEEVEVVVVVEDEEFVIEVAAPVSCCTSWR